MTNSKRQMPMSSFINLIREVSMHLLNGNANFETLKEMKLKSDVIARIKARAGSASLEKNYLLKEIRYEDFQ